MCCFVACFAPKTETGAESETETSKRIFQGQGMAVPNSECDSVCCTSAIPVRALQGN